MKILNRNETWDLWQQGKKAWNAKIRSGDITEVTFNGSSYRFEYDFTGWYFPAKTYFKHINQESALPEGAMIFKNAHFEEVKFSDIHIHNGFISFENAIFNGQITFNKIVDFAQARFAGKANFDGAIFNDQLELTNTTFTEASFSNTTFNKPVDFSQARFSRKANFDGATFKGKPTFNSLSFTEVSFDGATFNGQPELSNTTFSKASFSNTTFNKPMDFSQAEFPGEINFDKAIFNESANFSHTTFVGDAYFGDMEVKSGIDFSSCEFKGATNFTGAKFSQKTNFESAIFEGKTKFIEAEFGMENNFEYTTFTENTYFNGITASEAHFFSFRGATFGKTFSIKSDERIGCVIDFIDTQAKYSLHLGDIACTFRREHKWLTNRKWLSCILKCLLSGFQTPEDSDDISRLRKLKKVAQEEKDHLRALDYKVQEMQAKRWHDIAGEQTSSLLKLAKTLPEFVFWSLSCYGRSLFMPAFWLLSMALLMGEVYYCLSSGHATTDHPQEQGISLNEPIDRWDAYGYSASQIFPWISIARDQQKLFREEIKDSSSVTFIKALSYIQTLGSTLLLFLLGLGARNRFLL